MSPGAITRSQLRKLSHGEFGALVDTLTARVEDLRTSFDAIVPLLRSGGVPATFLANRLQVELFAPAQYRWRRGRCTEVIRPSLPASLPGRARILVVDTNTVTGTTAVLAARALRAQRPESEIALATVVLDAAIQSIPGVDAIVHAKRSNEARTLGQAEAMRLGIAEEIDIFPWEDEDQQWREISGQPS